MSVTKNIIGKFQKLKVSETESVRKGLMLEGVRKNNNWKLSEKEKEMLNKVGFLL